MDTVKTKEVIRNYWDYRCKYYNNGVVDQSEEERNAWKNMLGSAISAVGDKSPRKILDVGTGPGFIALMLAEMGHDVTGIDLSTVMLEQARKNAAARSLVIDFRQGDAENLEFSDGSFDVVSNKFLLWTLPNPGKAIAEWFRVLKHGGIMIAIDGDWYDPGLYWRIVRGSSDIIHAIKERHYPLRQRRRYASIKKNLPLYSLKPDRVSSFIQEAGFANIQIEPVDNLCSSARKRGNLLDKLDYAYSIYFIKAVKP
ncbi:MAG: class I SAM-dependent methyltransferase [Candidatus Bathyarchaeia archaeon]|jgi:ubiquinone/menaquinone biosynthesis C-methylase UbiE